MSVLLTLAIVAGIIGILGSIVPGIPGPPLSWLGLLFIFIEKTPGPSGDPMTSGFLFLWLAITVVVSVLDYVVPAYLTRVTGGSKTAAKGAIAGLVVGLIVPPVGMIVGSLLGAFLSELLIEDKGAWDSFKASLGAFLGFICGTLLKLTVAAIMMYYIIIYIV